MRKVWFLIAERIAHAHFFGPWICNTADRLFKDERISEKQLAKVLAVIQVERRRQGGSQVGSFALWPDVAGAAGRVVRIKFCTKQIRKGD